jgi:hypothetical protein
LKILVSDVPPEDEFAFTLPTKPAPEEVRRGFVGHTLEVWKNPGAENAIGCCTRYTAAAVLEKAYPIATTEMDRVLGKSSLTARWYATNRPAINCFVLIDKKVCRVVAD